MALALAAAAPAAAQADQVVVLGPHGHATVRNDRFLTGPTLAPVPTAGAGAVQPRGRAARGRAVTVRGALARLRRTHAITAAAYRGYLRRLRAAEASARRLGGTRAVELNAVLDNLREIAAARELSASRLPALFATLDRNRIWWTTGPLLGYGQRVEFARSQIVWEYYPGQGIELQELGSFGKADGLFTAGPGGVPRALRLLAELLPLAARRAGGLAWEYYFHFDGGSPPWTSAMSQATALEALTRAYLATHDPAYLRIARRALPVFRARPSTGVAVRTKLGRRYLLYSFDPGAAVINGFLQALIGLYDYAQVAHDRAAERLFRAGDAEARAEVPRYDTGAWSLYQPGIESTLDYHTLVTGFLHELCDRVHAQVYCATAQRFDSYLKTPPALALLTSALHVHQPGEIRFRLSKLSHVGIVLTRGTKIVFETSASFPYGVQSFAVPAPGSTGTYGVRLAATDQAGNFNRITGSVQVLR